MATLGVDTEQGKKYWEKFNYINILDETALTTVWWVNQLTKLFTYALILEKTRKCAETEQYCEQEQKKYVILQITLYLIWPSQLLLLFNNPFPCTYWARLHLPPHPNLLLCPQLAPPHLLCLPPCSHLSSPLCLPPSLSSVAGSACFPVHLLIAFPFTTHTSSSILPLT